MAWRTQTWQKLHEHRKEMEGVHMRELFAADAQRFDKMHLEVDELLIDFSKHIASQRTMELLVELAEETGVRQRIAALLSGAHVNSTEQRPALHTALRLPDDAAPLLVDGVDVAAEARGVRRRFLDFAERVRGGQWSGHSGAAITDVVSLGIGGSDLGPLMAAEALRPYWGGVRVHFVSNVDPSALADCLRPLRRETTLFVVVSKSFTTPETLANARAARDWLLAAAPPAAVAQHFVAVSTNLPAVQQFGIGAANAFAMWDWVGGRYSLWSAVGVGVAIAVGRANFEALLAGAHAIDAHFGSAPLAANAPALLALLAVWYRNFFGAQTTVVVPYSQHLRLLPDYLQQTEMESNGKTAAADGAGGFVPVPTGAALWGTAGTNGQHAYFQLLHQGALLAPIDFVAASLSHDERADAAHAALLANMLAQAQALLAGRPAPHDPHRHFAGNRPSTTVLLAGRLSPRALGALLALYEHKVFVESVLWGINAFDQFGVELGKQLAVALLADLRAADAPPAGRHDASTSGLLAAIRQRRAAAGAPK